MSGGQDPALGSPDERISDTPVTGVGMNGFAVQNDIGVGGNGHGDSGQGLRLEAGGFDDARQRVVEAKHFKLKGR